MVWCFCLILSIKKKYIEEIIKHSEELFPIEACGILVGRKEKKRKQVKTIRRTRNILNSSSRYQIDPEDLRFLSPFAHGQINLYGQFLFRPFSGLDSSSAEREFEPLW